MTDIKCVCTVKAYIVKCAVIYTRWVKDHYTNSKQGYFLTLRGARFWQETQNCWPNGLLITFDYVQVLVQKRLLIHLVS